MFSPHDQEVWHEVQRLIKLRARHEIIFPDWFKEVARYVGSDNVGTRRHFKAFLKACETVARIRSFRKRSVTKGRRIAVTFRDLAITLLIFNEIFSQTINRADDEDLDVRRAVRTISDNLGGKPVRGSDLAKKLGVSLDRAYGSLRRAVAAGAVNRVNRPSKNNVKLYLPSRLGSFLPDPQQIFQGLDCLPAKVRFTHPLTGERVTYRRDQ